MTTITVPVQYEPGAKPLRRAHEDDAGGDLAILEDCVIPAGSHRKVSTGVRVGIPQGYVGEVHVRSSTGIRDHVVLSNGTGIIDSGYTGEIILSLHNQGTTVRRYPAGAYLAQLVIREVPTVKFLPVTHLEASERGTAGIGSTDAA